MSLSLSSTFTLYLIYLLNTFFLQFVLHVSVTLSLCNECYYAELTK